MGSEIAAAHRFNTLGLTPSNPTDLHSSSLSRTRLTWFFFTLKVFKLKLRIFILQRLGNSANSSSGMWNFSGKNLAKSCASGVTECFFFSCSRVICHQRLELVPFASFSLIHTWCLSKALSYTCLAFCRSAAYATLSLFLKAVSFGDQIFWHRCSHQGKGLVIVGFVLGIHLLVTSVITILYNTTIQLENNTCMHVHEHTCIDVMYTCMHSYGYSYSIKLCRMSKRAFQHDHKGRKYNYIYLYYYNYRLTRARVTWSRSSDKMDALREMFPTLSSAVIQSAFAKGGGSSKLIQCSSPCDN